MLVAPVLVQDVCYAGLVVLAGLRAGSVGSEAVDGSGGSGVEVHAVAGRASRDFKSSSVMEEDNGFDAGGGREADDFLEGVEAGVCSIGSAVSLLVRSKVIHTIIAPTIIGSSSEISPLLVPLSQPPCMLVVTGYLLEVYTDKCMARTTPHNRTYLAPDVCNDDTQA